MKKTSRKFLRNVMLWIMCATMINFEVVAFANESVVFCKEDINFDGKITEDDAKELRRAIANWKVDKMYDINGDGFVDIRDLVHSKISIAKFVDDNKFETKEISEIESASVITLGTLFEQKEEITVDSSLVKVDITVVSSNVSYEYERNEVDWTKSTLEFDGVGTVMITIYDCCQPTSITVKIVDAEDTTTSDESGASWPNSWSESGGGWSDDWTNALQ